MKYWTSILISWCCVSSPLLAQDATGEFLMANEFYQQEQFSEALEGYESILISGYESAEIYYNLGNCYFKMNQLGPSLLNYKRAERLDPYDDEIRHNLNLAQKAAIDDFENMPAPLFRSAYIGLLLLLSANTWALLGIIAMGLMALGTFFYLFTAYQRVGFIGAIIGFLGGLLFISLAIANHSYEKKNLPAIVMTASSYAKSGPGEKAEDVFILHEGAEIKVIESYENWRKIRLPDGKVGWLDANDIKAI